MPCLQNESVYFAVSYKCKLLITLTIGGELRPTVNAKMFQWKRINCKQSTRWQHLSQLKASTFLFENYFLGAKKTQQIILEIGNAI
jgi:hypothetical protein